MQAALLFRVRRSWNEQKTMIHIGMSDKAAVQTLVQRCRRTIAADLYAVFCHLVIHIAQPDHYPADLPGFRCLITLLKNILTFNG